MRGRTPIWLLVLCLAWQGIALAGAGGRWSGIGDTDHERMHRENRPHHHGVDGTIAPDDSVASLLHTLVDLGSTVSITSLVTVILLSPTSVVPARWVDAIPPGPCLDGPTRPPRSIV